MTSLERARAHLLRCQAELAADRSAYPANDPLRPQREASVLAALSWVWEEQERERQSYGIGPVVAALRFLPPPSLAVDWHLVCERFNDIANGRD